MKKISDYGIDWVEKIAKAESNYKFQPNLTQKLDSHVGDFTELTLLEIVLWKTNRYPEIKDNLLDDINNLRKEFTIEKAKLLLKKLLALKGFDLPMASTVLRFASPNNLQIIDQRVYRFITADVVDFKKPYNDDKKVEMYFDYIERLKQVCSEYNIPFEKSDRIIYQLDKDMNTDYPIKY